jgi:putative phage-type endonuclease
MIIHDCKQGTDEWRSVRAGKLTASNAQAIATGGKGLETLVWQTLAEEYANVQEEGYSSEAMERGKELEAEARMAYEIERGVFVREVGFVEMDEYTGASTDGLVEDDGILEIKCPSNAVFFRYSVERKIDPKYYAQMQMGMLCSGRAWCDYVVYSPNFEKSIVVVRVEKDPIMQEKLLKGIEKGKQLIKEI